MKRFVYITSCLLLTGIHATSAFAQTNPVLVSYDDNLILTLSPPIPARSQVNATSNDPNVVPNPLTLGPGLTAAAPTSPGTFAAKGFPFASGTGSSGTTLAQAQANGWYLTWGFTVPAGNSAIVTDVIMNPARTGGAISSGGTGGPQFMQLFWTTDGGVTLTPITSSFGTGSNAPTYSPPFITSHDVISGLNISVAAGQTLELRLYAWKPGNNGLMQLTGPITSYTTALDVYGTTVSAPTGACCTDSTCAVGHEIACAGSYKGDTTTCESSPCVTVLSGACCTGTQCNVVLSTACPAANYQGDNTVCGLPTNPTTCCPANVDGLGGVTVSDIFAFLRNWFAKLPSADFDNSGGTPAVSDIFAFLRAWFAKC